MTEQTTIPQPRTKPGVAGFLKKDISTLIGQRFGLLTIRGRAPRRPDANLRVECDCDCGGHSQPRLADVTSGKVVSCGCVGKKRYTGHWQRRAKQLPAALTQKIIMGCAWFRHNTALIAKLMKLPKVLVDFVRRLHLDAIPVPGRVSRMPRWTKRDLEREERDLERAERSSQRWRRFKSEPGPPIVCSLEDIAEACPSLLQWCAV